LILHPIRNGRVARYGRRAGLLAGLAFLLTSVALVPLQPTLAGPRFQTGPRGTIPHTDVNPYGVNVFLHKEVEAPKIPQTLDLVAGAHIAWIKQDFVWSDIEIAGKGNFQDTRNGAAKSAWAKYDDIVSQAEQRHLQLVARISFAPAWARAAKSGPNDAPQNNADLADFAAAILDHYKGRIKYIQVWNEPNLAYEWKQGGKVDPQGYVAMLKAVYTRVKQVDPTVTILSAPLAINLETIDYAGNLNELDYWDQMYKAGAKDYFDILSANAYGLDLPPADPPDRTKLNFRRVELLRNVMVANGDANKAVWFNEYGWNASPTTLSQEEQLHWRRVDPDVQAKWTVDGIQYALDNWPWAGVFFIWYFRQVGDIPPDKAEYYFRLVDPDFTIQPVYKAVRRAAGLYQGPGAMVTPAAGAPTPAAGTPAGSTDTPGLAGAPTATPGGSGAPPTAAVIAATPVPVAPPGSSSPNLLPLILGGLLVLIGIGAIAFYLMRRAT